MSDSFFPRDRIGLVFRCTHIVPYHPRTGPDELRRNGHFRNRFRYPVFENHFPVRPIIITNFMAVSMIGRRGHASVDEHNITMNAANIFLTRFSSTDFSAFHDSGAGSGDRSLHIPHARFLITLMSLRRPTSTLFLSVRELTTPNWASIKQLFKLGIRRRWNSSSVRRTGDHHRIRGGGSASAPWRCTRCFKNSGRIVHVLHGIRPQRNDPYGQKYRRERASCG